MISLLSVCVVTLLVMYEPVDCEVMKINGALPPLCLGVLATDLALTLRQ